MYPVLLNGTPRRIANETEHNSKWIIKDRHMDTQLTLEQQKTLKGLILNNQWIIEESNNLIDMMEMFFFLI